jgi:hypothetical protein
MLPWGQHCAVEGLADGARSGLISLRPEDIAITRNPYGPARITGTSFAGNYVHYTLRLGELSLRASRAGAAPLLGTGDCVTLAATALPL